MTLQKRKYCGKVAKSNVIPSTGVLEYLTKGYSYFHDEPSREALKNWYSRSLEFIMDCIGRNIQQEIDAKFSFAGIVIPHGSRPWCWWEWSAPEPRQLISGDPAGAITEKGLSFGRPRFYRSLETFNMMVYESQIEYLTRLNLLLPEEKNFHQTTSQGA